MASRTSHPLSTGQVALVGGASLALAAGVLYWATRPKKGELAPTGNVPPSTEPLTFPGPPTSRASLHGDLAHLAGSEVPPNQLLNQGQLFKEAPAPYVISAYTVRWVPERGEWGQWSAPSSFRGHVTDHTWTGKPIYSSPDDDLIEYLDALGLTNPAPGVWIAYEVPIVQEDRNGVPTQYGRQGPWISGRYGDLRDLNSDPALRFFHQYLATEAVVTEYDWIDASTVGGQHGVYLPLEKKLA